MVPQQAAPAPAVAASLAPTKSHHCDKTRTANQVSVVTGDGNAEKQVVDQSAPRRTHSQCSAQSPATSKSPPSSPQATSAVSYLNSLISKSQILLQSLKKQQQQTSFRSEIMQQQQHQEQSSVIEQEAADTGKMRRRQAEEMAPADLSRVERPLESGAPFTCNSSGSDIITASSPRKPPLPPPPARHVLQAAASASALSAQVAAATVVTATAAATTTNRQQPSGCPLPAFTQSLGAQQTGVGSQVASARRHALQEQSLERDAALSLKTRELKHKRTSSIKSALRHASHLAGSSLRSAGGIGAGSSSSASSPATSSGCSSGQVKSQPYELFEPPVTQRTYQRSRRRGAMSDPKRQMSADTIGLRQLTDEYLQNAGVKPISSSGKCSLVALTQPIQQQQQQQQQHHHQSGLVTASTCQPLGAAVVDPSAGVRPSRLPMANLGAIAHQFSIEAQLYQASRQGPGGGPSSSSGGGVSGATSSQLQQQQYQYQSITSQQQQQQQHSSSSASDDSLSTVAVFPGNLPWQSDVSIQCELLQAPRGDADDEQQPYETTGDILNTIAGPFRLAAGTGPTAAVTVGGGGDNGAVQQLSATLKRGLTAAIGASGHPATSAGGSGSAAALNVVVGSLKKSLSNTLDISRASALHAAHHLHSEDSLPAYSSLHNEPESPPAPDAPAERDNTGGNNSNNATGAGGSLQTLEANESVCGSSGGGGLIGQLASKLTRQSSRKFTVSKKGLQRALSFDCRGGYKKLEQQQQQQQQQQLAGNQKQATGGGSQQPQQRAHLLATCNKLRAHNKSSMALSVDRSSQRPYLAQSASQVDFQLPLLPYHRMQEAIVAQRRLDQPAPPSEQQSDSATAIAQREMDADELLCGHQNSISADEPLPVEPIRVQERPSTVSQVQDRNAAATEDGQRQYPIQRANSNRSSLRRRNSPPQQHQHQQYPPKLVLDIPVISTPTQQQQHKPAPGARKSGPSREDVDDGGEEVCAVSEQDNDALQSKVIVCLPSPNIAIDPSFNVLSNSNSFCLNPDSNGANQLFAGRNQLTATDVFANSSNLIKRPSTLVTSETMTQVAQVLSKSVQQSCTATSNNSNNNSKPTGSQVPVILRNRRQAIVPPKLVTDANQSDGESSSQPQVGQLVDVGSTSDDELESDKLRARQCNQLDGDEAATVRALRRKRSGGGTMSHQASATHSQDLQGAFYDQKQQVSAAAARSRTTATGRRLSGSQTALPTFCIEPDNSAGEMLDQQQQWQQRPDSQMTNVDSIASSGSSTNLSQKANGKREFTVTSAGGLTVSFGSSPARRRSSIAVIPQMQICPGDLLVYSKQLIDRMNQSDEVEPPQFLTIDDKKAKNIWSSFKLFDSRTLKARNELLCSLEDVLASLQPSTFVDEQLSHYKGMLWNEFLYETESRRSASSEVLSVWVNDNDNSNSSNNNNTGENNQHNDNYGDNQPDVRVQISRNVTKSVSAQQSPVDPTPPILVSHEQQEFSRSKRELVKVTRSSGGFIHSITSSPSSNSATTAPGTGGSTTPTNNNINIVNNNSSSSISQQQQKRPSREPAVRSISSRFREKPKLKRGQTVDSVFRIPLIPSSPLKHAQQHQQTPTAHLEDHDLSITLEDDERSSPSSSLAAFQPTATNANVAAPGPRSMSPLRNRTGHSGSSSTRSRAGSASQRSAQQTGAVSADFVATPTTNGGGGGGGGSLIMMMNDQQQPDSSFEADDAMDLINDQKRSSGGQSARTTPHQIVRQSSLSTLSSTITRTEQKRQRALWDLFQSECAFFFDHLMTLKNVYMEPLKKIQVEGFAMFADPDVLFGNLDELCCGVYDFCKEFLYIIMRTLKTRPEELNATDVLIKLYKKNPKIDHLRGVYHRYTLNYINALTYLESLRRQVEFVEFEKWSSRDVRCKKLQLTDLLVAPVQHIMRVPIILKDIESHTENSRDRDEIRAILAVEEASLRELDDKMRWLKNFERLLEIQKNISWPSILEMDPKLFIPDSLKELLSKQPCEKLIVSPRRQIVHEGTLSNFDQGKACDMHVILFDDMLLLTRRKKGLTKKASTVCKTNSGGSSIKEDGSFKYIVYKNPLSLDRFYVHDVQQENSQSFGMKHFFLLIVLNRFQQITNVHSFSAPNDDIKQTWLFKIKKTIDRWKKNYANSSNEQEQHNQSATYPVTNIVTQEPVSYQKQQQQQFAPSTNSKSTDYSTPSQRAQGIIDPSQSMINKRNSSEFSADRRSPIRNDIGDTSQHGGIMIDAYDGQCHNQSMEKQQPIELVITGVQSPSSGASSRDNVTSAA